LSQWSAKLFRYLGGYNPRFDINHPFSQLLIQYCQIELPNEIHLELKELFRVAWTLPGKEIQARQEKLLDSLIKGGLLPDGTAKIAIPLDSEYSHECPYGHVRMSETALQALKAISPIFIASFSDLLRIR